MNDKPKSSVIIHEENEEEEDPNEVMNDAILHDEDIQIFQCIPILNKNQLRNEKPLCFQND